MLTDSTLSRTGLESPIDDLVARVERIVRCRTGGRIRDLRVQVQGGDVIISGSLVHLLRQATGDARGAGRTR